MKQNKSSTIELATKLVIKEMNIKLLDRFRTSDNYRAKLHSTIEQTAKKYQLKPTTLIRLFQ